MLDLKQHLVFYHSHILSFQNPQVLQKAQAEVDQYDEITVDILSKLKYIDAVFKETLRLQPTAPVFNLELKGDTITLPDGYEVCKEDILVLLPQLHRDPKVWDRSEEFLPERMLNGGFENLPPNAWKPFGNGQRGCIGRPFAWQESLLVMALVLKHFHLELIDPSYDLRIKQTLTIKPDGLKMRVRSRKSLGMSFDTSAKQPEIIPQKPTTKTETTHFQPMSVFYDSNSGSCESFARTPRI